MISIMGRLSIFYLIFLLSRTMALSQCPTGNFSMASSGCINESLALTSTISGSSFSWDLCGNDLDSTPAATLLFRELGWDGVVGLRLIKDQSNWYGFVTSGTNNKLFRLDFGADLQNPTPIINDLGNPGNLLNSPESIAFGFENGIWYGLIINFAESSIIRLNFGDKVINNPTPDKITIDSSINLSFGSSIQLLNDNGTWTSFLVNRGGNDLVRITFGTSLANTPTISALNLTGFSSPRGLSFSKRCNGWYGFLVSTNTNQVHQLFFTDLSMAPSQSTLSNSGVTLTGITTPIILYDNARFYIIASSTIGNIYRIDLGSDISNTNVVAEDLTNFGLLPNSSAFDLIALQGYVYGYSIGNNKFIYSIKFEQTCSATTPYVMDSTMLTATFTQAGSYQVELQVESSDGTIIQDSHPITISSSQAPQMTSQITGNCLSSPVNFSGQQVSGNITGWNWDFGDGSGTSSQQTSTYSYAAAGAYQVRLTTTDANGCTNLLIDSVQVYNDPIPGFSTPSGTLCKNTAISFTNTTTGESGPAVSWTWNFNGEGTSNLKDPSFTFTTPGNKTISLTSSLTGCSNVTQQVIFIEEAPASNFSFDNVCNTQTTTFTDLTTGSNITTWNWDFGDSSNSTSQNPTHTYINPGNFEVSLTVSNSLGCSSIMVDTVFNHALPLVSFVNDLPCSSSPIQFTDQSSVLNASVVSWEWTFGDGNTSSDRNPSHTYGQTGDFPVQLKAFSQFGCVDSASATLSVIQGPQVNFSWDKACSGETISFTDLTNSVGEPISDWTWLIDNNVLNSQNPQFTFSGIGTFPVQLSVTTSNLCAQAMTKNISVGSPPSPSFTFTESCSEGTTTFSDTSTGVIFSREWTVDNQVVAGDSLMTTSLEPGAHAVSLAVVSDAGCSATINNNIEIMGGPKADFSVSTDYGAAPLHALFANSSTGADTYLWSFGDNDSTISSSQDPSFIYADTGVYNVTLISNGGSNCADTLTKSIQVVPIIQGISIDGLTLLDSGKVVIALTNQGSVTYDESNLTVALSLDNSSELAIPFRATLFPKQSINFVPDATLSDTGKSRLLCVSAQLLEANNEISLDKECLNLTSQSQITKVYPNPTDRQMSVDVIAINNEKIHLLISDRSGVIVYEQSNLVAQRGLNTYSIDTTPLRPGLYLIRLITSDRNETMKFMVNR